ncbi:OLC1v1009022C1 [Oldenlandia corymbosa var. corymbosa]|uniref:OLC1v1009022C1 n=1 Tax=Oldenlandia corymbosa var. corymbosa TaxID=529605 RepID=A0AAV1DQF8_OLDCO|nr:OLC1v1009022C1 [Oldenlandia corymbosa var. corymbosa]
MRGGGGGGTTAVGWRRRRLSLLHWFLISSSALTTGLGLFILIVRSAAIDAQDYSSTTLVHLHHHHRREVVVQATPDRNNPEQEIDIALNSEDEAAEEARGADVDNSGDEKKKNRKGCATVEEMGEIFKKGFRDESLRARQIIHHHFSLHGAPRVRSLPPKEFCEHGFVLAKASEAGFGNEMYKILTAAALSVMLNRSLIIGQTRGKYPFGEYILYSNLSFTLNEVKHLWRMNHCATKYGRHLVMRIDDFQKPARTEVLCGNWKEWGQPIIWFQNTTDAVAAQFFLKNIHPQMRKTASDLFGTPENLQYRPNVFGELMRVLISPSQTVERAVSWALGGRHNPDIVLHMRMLMNRSVRAVQAALQCIRKSAAKLSSRPIIVVVSDTPSLLEDIKPKLVEFSEVIHFDFEHFEGNITEKKGRLNSNLNFRAKDWGPAPRWVAFVDFFLASRAKHAVITGAQRRVGTTYAQLIAALAAAYQLADNSSAGSDFTYLSSFQSNLLSEGLKNQIGWGHVWNRFAGPLSCSEQTNQCAFTPVLPPAWWDGLWQSPTPRDVRRMEAYGIRLSQLGTVDEDYLHSFCVSNKKKTTTLTVTLI